MVNVNETTCLCPAPAGGVFAGTAGGGIARWTEDGALATLHTTADGGIATNHIVDMAPDVGSCLAIGDTEEPLVYATGAIGDRWFTVGKVEGAQGPLRALEGNDEGFLVLDASGAVYLSATGASWSRLDPKYGLRTTGWEVADRDGDILAVSNGTDVVMVDLKSINHWTRSSPPVVDIDVDGDKVAIACPDHPDVYDLGTDSWLDENVTRAIMAYGQGWSLVTVEGNKFTSATLEGLVIEANITINNSGGLKLQGTISDKTDANVTDMLPLANGTVLVSTMRGNWVLHEGEAMPFLTSELSMPPSNDILSVSYEADALWVLTPEGLASLSFDSRGLPAEWNRGPYLGEGVRMGTLDTAYLGGTVYLCGYGPGVHTYDTFASSAPNRWGRAHMYGDARDDVEDVAVVDGALYTGGPYGVDRMQTGPGPPAFVAVDGAPSGVLCLQSIRSELLYVGTDQGLWEYDPTSDAWEGPGEHPFTLPDGPISDIAFSGIHLFFAIGDAMASPQFDGAGETVVFAEGEEVVRLAARDGVADPTWAVVGGGAFAYESNEMRAFSEPEREFLGDAWVHDLDISPDGVVCLATGSGLHRVDRYGMVWSEWTTSNGLSANDVRTLALVEDRGDLWVGAYGGVDVLDVATEGITRIGVEDGIPSNLVYDVELEDGSVWIGTDVGGAAVADLDDLEWLAYNTSTGIIADDVQSVAVWGDRVLFGTDEGVTVLDRSASTFNSYTAGSSDLPDDWVWTTLSVDEGVYVGTDGGLAMYSFWDEPWRGIDVEGVAGHHVRAVAVDPMDRLWVGTEEGIQVLTMDSGGDVLSVTTLDVSHGLPGSEVLAIEPVSDGAMWVGTSAGAAIVDTTAGVKATFTTDDGLVHDRVTAIQEGADGTIWLGTAGGLSRLRKDDWDLHPQWTSPREDIPDVYVALDGVTVEPEAPNEGDGVQVRVTVSNPSGKRAIVHVGLFGDLEGAPGDEVSSGIAYTEPGSSYQVTLTWTAVGGEQNLWIVADPADLVPESNERNNVVALSIHVNRPPTISDLGVLGPFGNLDYPDQAAMVFLGFVYGDVDGDRPVAASARVEGYGDAIDLVVPPGSPLTGIQFGLDRLDIPLGNSTIRVEVTDGRASTEASLDMSVHLSIRAHGLDGDRDADGMIRFSVEVVGPWEGELVDGVEVFFAGPGTDPSDATVWDEIGAKNLSVPAVLEGDEWVVDASGVRPGTYDAWVIASDDRQIMALHVEEGVVIEEPSTNEGADWIPWALMAVVFACIAIALVVMRIRGSRE